MRGGSRDFPTLGSGEKWQFGEMGGNPCGKSRNSGLILPLCPALAQRVEYLLWKLGGKSAPQPREG